MTDSNPPDTLSGVYKPAAKPQQSLGICIYGRGGVGKTTLVGTMPGRGLVIDVPQIEGGTFVLSNVADRIDVKPVEKWDDVDDVFWFLKEKNHDYQWVAIDSITAFVELAKRKCIKERKLDEDPHTTTMQEWGKIGNLCSEMIYKFRTLRQHTIWIAQERTHGSEERGEAVQIGPNVTPATLTALTPSMMILARLSVENNAGTYERRLRIGPHPTYMTKVRAMPGKDVPSVIRDPHLGKLLKFLVGSGERPEEVDEFAGIIIS